MFFSDSLLDTLFAFLSFLLNSDIFLCFCSYSIFYNFLSLLCLIFVHLLCLHLILKIFVEKTSFLIISTVLYTMFTSFFIYIVIKYFFTNLQTLVYHVFQLIFQKDIRARDQIENLCQSTYCCT